MQNGKTKDTEIIKFFRSSNNKKINNLRAKLLINTFKKTSYETVVSDMIRETLKLTPSYSEILKCPVCHFSKENIFPLITVSKDIYNDNMKNLEAAINENFPNNMVCQCMAKFNSVRDPGGHLFVEVFTSLPFEQRLGNCRYKIFLVAKL